MGDTAAIAGTSDPDAVLSVRELTKSFGNFRAVAGVDFDVRTGEALGLLGPNGSGKTTIINVISGIYRPDGGTVMLNNENVTGKPSHRLCRLGLNRTFQIPRPLGDLTVAENLDLVYGRRHRPDTRTGIDPLAFVGLDGLAASRAGALTSGEQKLLDLARALAADPTVLLVDELGAGLSPQELDHVAQLLCDLKDAGLALVVVEHLMGFLELVANRVLVLDAGAPIFRGSLRKAIADPGVVEVFLGEHP